MDLHSTSQWSLCLVSANCRQIVSRVIQTQIVAGVSQRKRVSRAMLTIRIIPRRALVDGPSTLARALLSSPVTHVLRQ